MIVELVASTVVTGWGHMRDAGWVDRQDEVDGDTWDAFENNVDADYLAEFAGRLCYQSWSRPNPATTTNAGYLVNILWSEHFSVLEHSSASFYVAEVSRSLLAELTRHRHLSFSVLSQRYVDESNPLFITPPAIAQHAKVHQATASALATDCSTLAAQDRVTDVVTIAYKTIYEDLIAAGLDRKAARGAARSVLPQMTETKFIVTGNLRAWRDVIKKRIAPAAEVEIRQLATELLRQLRELAPNTFQDSGHWEIG
jgi:thymidylate synthase (FAD)